MNRATPESEFEMLFEDEDTHPHSPPPNGAEAKQQGGLGEWNAGDDDWNIPPRGWLLKNIFCRGFVSSLLADGGTGKTAMRVAQLMSLAIGRPLTGEYVFQRCRVLILSFEDGRDELRRRVRAAMLHHGVTNADFDGWLFLAALSRQHGKLMETDGKGHLKEGTLAATIKGVIARRGIDIVCFDPFVKTHGVEENSNSAMDAVIQVLSDMTADYDIAVDIPHHTAKGASDPGNANRGRGASAVKDGGRLVYTLSPMSVEEAQTFGLSEDKRRQLVRMDSAKVNLTPPMTMAKWFRLVDVPLGNPSTLYPNGDNVQTVEPWTPPDTWAGLNNDLLNRILTEIAAGLPDGNRYSDGPNATDRAAWRVVQQHAPAKTEGQSREIIKTWVKTGLLVHRGYENPATRKTAQGLFVDDAKRPE